MKSLTNGKMHQDRVEVNPAFCLWHDLGQFVTQTKLSLTTGLRNERAFHSFEGGQVLESECPTRELGQDFYRFIKNAAHLVEYCHTDIQKRGGIQWIDGAGPAYDGVGLDRRIIANELCQQCCDAPHGDIWQRDICNILSFLSQMSQKRYEGAPPYLTIAYYPSNGDRENFGVLGKSLLDEYKGLIRMLRDPHTVVVTQQGCRITDILDNQRFDVSESNVELEPVPPRLVHLQHLTLANGSVHPVIFNLNPNGAIEILANGRLIFRKVNNRWRFLNLSWIRETIRQHMGHCGNALVPYNFLTLSMDLADRAEGALLFLCAEPTDDVLHRLLQPRESLIRNPPSQSYQELTARTRFTLMVAKRRLSLGDRVYHQITPLLRDICGIDGATVFSYGGELLGFGAIVQFQSFEEGFHLHPTALEGARSTAARMVSRKGIAAKISSDGDAWLWIDGRPLGCFC